MHSGSRDTAPAASHQALLSLAPTSVDEGRAAGGAAHKVVHKGVLEVAVPHAGAGMGKRRVGGVRQRGSGSGGSGGAAVPAAALTACSAGRRHSCRGQHHRLCARPCHLQTLRGTRGGLGRNNRRGLLSARSKGRAGALDAQQCRATRQMRIARTEAHGAHGAWPARLMCLALRSPPSPSLRSLKALDDRI